jgi:hypothetical protein
MLMLQHDWTGPSGIDAFFEWQTVRFLLREDVECGRPEPRGVAALAGDADEVAIA